MWKMVLVGGAKKMLSLVISMHVFYIEMLLTNNKHIMGSYSNRHNTST